jgi:hypothetical protein
MALPPKKLPPKNLTSRLDHRHAVGKGAALVVTRWAAQDEPNFGKPMTRFSFRERSGNWPFDLSSKGAVPLEIPPACPADR